MVASKQHETITLVGYGSQGKAWASNLRESGYLVEVLLPAKSASHARAWHNGFVTGILEPAAFTSKTYALLIPDHLQADFLKRYQHWLPKGATLIFAHGYSLTFDRPPLRPDLDVLLVSPKIVGPKLRHRFLHGEHPPTFAIGVWQNSSGNGWLKASRLAYDIGGSTTRIIFSNFKEECFANLFFEQVLFCGGLPGMIEAAYDTMVDKGINPDLAYVSCIHEIKLMAEMIAESGLDGMLDRVSKLARLGGTRARRYLIDSNIKEKLRQLYQDIEQGQFDLYVKQATQPTSSEPSIAPKQQATL